MIDFDAEILAACQEEFGWPIVFSPKGANPVALTGIFGNDFLAVDGVGNMVIQSRKPVLGIRQSVLRLAGARLPRAKDHIQVKNPVTGDCLHFEVTSAEPDAEGDVQVHLIKAP